MTRNFKPHLKVGVMVSSLLLLTASAKLNAQEKKIKPENLPAAIRTAFTTGFPNAKIKGASTEVEGSVRYYEIESVDGSVRRDLLYSAEGALVEVEETIPNDALPESLRASLTRNYAKAEVVRSERVVRGTDTTFEVTMKIGSKRKEVKFNGAGVVLKDETKTTPKSKEMNRKESKDAEDDD